MKNEDAVSPVVGVMLMLVVTIIIAAVVSGFAGGLVGTQDKSPTLSMDVTIVNTGSYIGSGLTAYVTGVSEPISTSDLKIITSWSTTMKDNTSAGLTDNQQAIPEGNIFTGGNITTASTPNVFCWQGMKTKTVTNWSTAPFGMGAGVDNTNPTDPIGNTTSRYDRESSWFGHYALQSGVNLYAYPYGSDSGMALGGAAGKAADGGYNGATQYAYAEESGKYEQGQIDPTQAVLGYGWEQLRAGDTVNIKVIYTSTGTAVFSRDVTVTEG